MSQEVPGYDAAEGFANHRGHDAESPAGAAAENAERKKSREDEYVDPRSEEIFAGAMNMLGLLGHEQAGGYPSDSLHTFRSDAEGKELFPDGLALRNPRIHADQGTPVAVEIRDRFDFAREGVETPLDHKTRVTDIDFRPIDGPGAVKRPGGAVEVPFIPLNGIREGDFKRIPGSAVSHIPDRHERQAPSYSEAGQLTELGLRLIDGEVSTVSWKPVNGERVTLNVSEIRQAAKAVEWTETRGEVIADRQMSAIIERVKGMMDQASPALQELKTKRVDTAQADKDYRERLARKSVDELPF